MTCALGAISRAPGAISRAPGFTLSALFSMFPRSQMDDSTFSTTDRGSCAWNELIMEPTWKSDLAGPYSARFLLVRLRARVGYEPCHPKKFWNLLNRVIPFDDKQCVTRFMAKCVTTPKYESIVRKEIL